MESIVPEEFIGFMDNFCGDLSEDDGRILVELAENGRTDDDCKVFSLVVNGYYFELFEHLLVMANSDEL